MRFPISRRASLINLGALGLMGIGGCAPQINSHSREDQITGLFDGSVIDAFFYAFGPYEFARSLQALSGQIDVGDTLVSRDKLAQAAGQDGVLLNRHAHVTDLADERIRSVTAPNNDTLYTSAVLELSQTPVRVTLPASGDRYLTVALMDMFTDQAAMIGADEHGGKGGVFTIVGPDTPPVDDANVIRLPSNDVWLLVRTFVAGTGDLEAARAVQSGVIVEPVDANAVARRFKITAPAEMESKTFLGLTNELLGRSPSHPQLARAAPFSSKGVVPGQIQVWSNLPAGVRAAWSAWLPRSLAMIRKGLSSNENGPGWNAPPGILGDYGANDVVRSAIALIGFGALKTEDARYFRAETDAAGDPLTGEASYRMRILAQGVPVEAFWSLSVYQPDDDGRLYFFPVPIDRHSINSGSSDIRRRPDGSIMLHLSATRPEGNDMVWVPIPSGKFQAIFRTYDPKPAIVDGSWTVPPMKKL